MLHARNCHCAVFGVWLLQKVLSLMLKNLMVGANLHELNNHCTSGHCFVHTCKS